MQAGIYVLVVSPSSSNLLTSSLTLFSIVSGLRLNNDGSFKQEGIYALVVSPSSSNLLTSSLTLFSMVSGD